MNARRLATAAFLVVAALVPGFVRAGPPGGHAPPLPHAAPPPGAERVEIVVRFPPWQYTGGRFQAASARGLVGDRGSARDSADATLPEGEVERVLEGVGGTLTLRMVRGVKPGAFPQVFGRWTIVRGTGRYARLRGDGTYTATDAGSGPTGSPAELQLLVGRVYSK